MSRLDRHGSAFSLCKLPGCTHALLMMLAWLGAVFGARRRVSVRSPSVSARGWACSVSRSAPRRAVAVGSGRGISRCMEVDGGLRLVVLGACGWGVTLERGDGGTCRPVRLPSLPGFRLRGPCRGRVPWFVRTRFTGPYSRASPLGLGVRRFSRRRSGARPCRGWLRGSRLGSGRRCRRRRR